MWCWGVVGVLCIGPASISFSLVARGADSHRLATHSAIRRTRLPAFERWCLVSRPLYLPQQAGTMRWSSCVSRCTNWMHALTWHRLSGLLSEWGVIVLWGAARATLLLPIPAFGTQLAMLFCAQAVQHMSCNKQVVWTQPQCIVVKVALAVCCCCDAVWMQWAPLSIIGVMSTLMCLRKVDTVPSYRHTTMRVASTFLTCLLPSVNTRGMWSATAALCGSGINRAAPSQINCQYCRCLGQGALSERGCSSLCTSLYVPQPRCSVM
jgi:hypothetical protein